MDNPDDPVWAVVGWGIHHYNEQQAGDTRRQQLCFVLRASDGKIEGGLIGATYWDWLYVDLLFVKEELRGHGYGHRLLEMAEEEARNAAQRMRTWIDSASKRPISISNMVIKILANSKTSLPGTDAIFSRSNFRK